LTTAVAIESAVAPGALPAAAAIGVVTVTAGVSSLDLAKLPGAEVEAAIRRYETMVASHLAADLDPLSGGAVAPRVERLSASTGAAGAVLVVSGGGFSGLPGGNTVRIGGVEATILGASGEAIACVVPAGAEAGGVVVETANGQSAAFPFSFWVRPVITSLSAPGARPGEAVTLTGTGFDGQEVRNTVLFGGQEVASTLTSPTSLAITVPAAAPVGPAPIVVQVPGQSSLEAAFAVWPRLVEDFGLATLVDAGASTASVSPGHVAMKASAAFDGGTGVDGLFHPTTDTVLDSSKTWQFTAIHIPAGVRVTGSDYRLTILCQGTARIDGILDVSGRDSTGLLGGAGAWPGADTDGVTTSLGNGPGKPTSGTSAMKIGPGAGHATGGGMGVSSSNTLQPRGTIYGFADLEAQPLEVGSGGGSSLAGGGGGGGGAIWLRVAGGLRLNGRLLANGGRGFGSGGWVGGGGSGGSIRLEAPWIVAADTAAIQAVGGAAQAGSDTNYGGAGRIRIDGVLTGAPTIAPAVGHAADVPLETATPQIFQSAPFDLGGGTHSTLAYERFTPEGAFPTGTEARFEFADAGADLAWRPWTTDLTALSGRYFRFRASLSTTDPLQTPVLTRFTLDYHP
ncbi:MAG: IPT/TIG domain-containing protein, partial [Candidatus Sericytochromatia bacterium]